MPLNDFLPSDLLWCVEPNAFNAWIAGNRADRGVIEAAALKSVRAGLPAEFMTKEGGVAIIALQGVMTKRATVFHSLGLGASMQLVQRAVEDAATDPAVKAIVLDVDSPGGSADGLAELSDAVFEARSIKPVVAHVSGMAASAALWAIAGADQIIAGKLDFIGSIGVRLMMFDLSRLFENAGIKPVVIDTGEFKSAGATGTVITEAQIAHFQGLVDTVFEAFVGALVRGRNLDDSAVRAVADGRIFPAPEAQAHGLIDGIGTLSETIAALQSGSLPGRRTIVALTPPQTEISTMSALRTSVPAQAPAAAPAAPAALAQPTAAPADAKGATLAELKTALPNADAEFLVDAATKSLDVDAAKTAWIARLETKAEAASKTTPAPVGNATPLGGDPTPYELGGAGADTGVAPAADPAQQFDALVRARMTNGLDRIAAVDSVRMRNPELHKAYVSFTNPGAGAQRYLAEKVDRQPAVQPA